MTALAQATDSLADWCAAVVAALRDSLPMFGEQHCEVADGETDAMLAGGWVAIEDSEHTMYVGVLGSSARPADVASLLLGPGAADDCSEEERNDAVREVANVIAGGVKTRMLLQRNRLLLGLPFVAAGPLRRGDPDDRRLVGVAIGDRILHLAIERQRHSPEKLRAVQLERELAAQQAKLTGILAAAADGIVTLRDGVVDTLNPAASRLFGIDLGQGIGRALCEFVPMWGDELAAAGIVAPVEACVRQPGGREVPVELRVAGFRGADGPMQTVVLRDIRERRRAEQELRRAHKLEAIGRLAAGLAHEMNTPAQYAGDSVDFVRTACADLATLADEYRRGIRGLADARAHAEVARRLRDREVAVDLEFLLAEVPAACDRTRAGIDRIAAIVAAMRRVAQAGDEDASELERWLPPATPSA